MTEPAIKMQTEGKQMEYVVDACTGKAFQMRMGDCITIEDIEGGQVVDFFAVNAEDHREMLSTGVTMDCNESLRVGAGDALYSSQYRVMFRILDDDVGEHDLLHPCCRQQMYEFFYRSGPGHSNCLDNINAALAGHGVSAQPIIHPFNIFMRTVIHPDGRISVEEPVTRPGDCIRLRAEMDVLVGLAACSVSESKCNGGRCSPIRVILESV